MGSQELQTRHYDAFRGNYLFRGLDEDAIARIAAMAEFKSCEEGDHLARRGSTDDDLYVVLDGDVNITADHREPIAQAGPGSVVGEVALVDDQPRSAHAVCRGMVTVARLPAGELRSYMSRNREVGFQLLVNLSCMMAARLRNTTAEYADLRESLRDPWEHAT